MGFFSKRKLEDKMREFERDGIVDLSYFDIVELSVDMNKAKKNLTRKQYNDVLFLYNHISKTGQDKKMVDNELYNKVAHSVFSTFDELAPFELYSKYDSEFTLRILKEIRDYKNDQDPQKGMYMASALLYIYLKPFEFCAGYKDNEYHDEFLDDYFREKYYNTTAKKLERETTRTGITKDKLWNKELNLFAELARDWLDIVPVSAEHVLALIGYVEKRMQPSDSGIKCIVEINSALETLLHIACVRIERQKSFSQIRR